MSKPFAVGDRVALYHNGSREEGRITNIYDDGLLNIELKNREVSGAHPKQCRRLVAKSPRRVTAVYKGLEKGLEIVSSTGQFNQAEWVQFIEVRKK